MCADTISIDVYQMPSHKNIIIKIIYCMTKWSHIKKKILHACFSTTIHESCNVLLLPLQGMQRGKTDSHHKAKELIKQVLCWDDRDEIKNSTKISDEVPVG